MVPVGSAPACCEHSEAIHPASQYSRAKSRVKRTYSSGGAWWTMRPDVAPEVGPKRPSGPSLP